MEKKKVFNRLGNLGLSFVLVLVLIVSLFVMTGMAAAGSGVNADRGGSQDSTPPQADPTDLMEGFEDITNLPGWFMQNNSSPLGSTGWFQGNDGVFPAQAGSSTSYIGANFNNTAGGTGTISNWLVTPVFNLNDGDIVSFWTRTATGSIWADRLELRMSTAGASTNVGTLATDVGDFTTVLTTVNPTQSAPVYPQVWTQFTVVISGVPVATDGRLAFRYFVTDAGPTGNNSNYIGIDTFDFTDATPPAAPDIAISKTPVTQTIVTGGNADFTITVTNTGDVDLDSVTVTDPLVPACDSAIGTLTVGTVNTYSCTDVGVAASYTNVVTVTSLFGTIPGPTASASAAVSVVPPTSVSLSGFEGSGKAATPIFLVALALLVVGLGFVMRRKLTA